MHRRGYLTQSNPSYRTERRGSEASPEKKRRELNSIEMVELGSDVTIRKQNSIEMVELGSDVAISDDEETAMVDLEQDTGASDDGPGATGGDSLLQGEALRNEASEAASETPTPIDGGPKEDDEHIYMELVKGWRGNYGAFVSIDDVRCRTFIC